MPSLKQLREHLLESGINENTRESVETHDKSLREAVRKASRKLGVREHEVAYELVQKGDPGIFGLGGVPFIVRVYPLEQDSNKRETTETFDDALNLKSFYIRLDKKKVYLKVSPPPLSQDVDEREVFTVLAMRTTESISQEKVRQVIRKASGKYEELKGYQNDITQDARVTCSVDPDGLSASIMVSPPGVNGADLGVRDIEAVLKQEAVLFGIQKSAVQNFVDAPTYNNEVTVAKGGSPKRGDNAWVEYKFETSPTHFMLNSSDDKIDYRELNNLQNVKAGEVIAVKHPAQEGQEGTSVLGKLLLADRGEDTSILVGDNVELSPNGLEAIAQKDGLAQIKKGRIEVEPIFYVNGDVDIKTGNIRFVGSVHVQGSITDGFTVEADGDIKVVGSIGKARVISQGNIFVYRGVAGKEEAYIEAKGSIWSRFVEHCTVKVGEMLVVSDGIINSKIMAFGSVICRGKRASIVGGEVRAAHFIDSKNLGAPSGVRTMVEVGTNPELLMQKEGIEAELLKQRVEIEKLPPNIATIHRKLKMLEIQRSESAEKEKKRLEEALETLQTEHSVLTARKHELEGELNRIQGTMTEDATEGVISVQRKLYSGVQVRISQAHLDVRKESQVLSLYNEDGVIRFRNYKQPKITIPNPP